MKLIVHGKNIEVTSALREYVEKKLGKLDKYSRHILETDVLLTVDKNPRIKDSHRAEVKVSTNGSYLRADESSVSMYAAIDLVSDKIERQLKKYEDKRTDSTVRKVKTSLAVSPVIPEDEVEEESPAGRMIRNRRFAVKPMSPDEAIAQMEMMSYNFLLFRNQDTEALNIVYKEDGENIYGLIIPEEAVEQAVVLSIPKNNPA